MAVANGTPAFSLVLHTWTQDLQRHIHGHAVMTCGVLGKDGQWHVPVRKPDFLFPVKALSRVFRGKFMAALAAAHRMGHIERDPQGCDDAWRERQRQLYKHEWVVYAKTPLGGPAQVLENLSRYTHRTAIGNERIRAVGESEVTFTVRGDDHGGKRRIRLDGAEFVRRFLLHVLPTGIKRIRHYGVLASACKGTKFNAARLALQMSAVNPQAVESTQAFMTRVTSIDVLVCSCRKVGRLHVAEVLMGPSPLAWARQHGNASGTGTAVIRGFARHSFAARLAAPGAVLRAAWVRTRAAHDHSLRGAIVNGVPCSPRICGMTVSSLARS